MEEGEFLYCIFLNCFSYFIAMKIFEKGNPGTLCRYNIGCLASMRTPPGSLPQSCSVAYAHHRQAPTAFTPPVACPLAACSHPPLPSLQETLGLPGLRDSALLLPKPTHSIFYFISRGTSLSGLSHLIDDFTKKY